MKIIRRINNNAAICEDNKGHQLVALGRGIGFGTLPRDVSLSAIEHTFYDIDPKYLSLIEELDSDVFSFAAQLVEIARTQVSHKLSPNLPITLADHIAFAIKRAQEHMTIRMPLAYEVEQSYPVEYKLGLAALHGIFKTFGIRLPKSEAVGIALSIINSSINTSNVSMRRKYQHDQFINLTTKIIEKQFNIKISKDSFDYARFITHINYLLNRIEKEESLGIQNFELYQTLLTQYPKATNCAQNISQLVKQNYDKKLTQEEIAYLTLHISRLSIRAGIIENSSDIQ